MNNGNCVEVGEDERAEVGRSEAVILVRDTNDRDGVTLTFAPGAWGEFTGSL